MATYRHRYLGQYVVFVGNGEGADDWGRYIRRMTTRPGWSVARLARQAGLNRSTIFGWIKDGGGSLTVASVLAVADGLEDDPVTALLAAGNQLSAKTIGETDPELAIIASSGLPDATRENLINYIMERRARDEAARIADLKHNIRMAGGEVA